MKKVFIRDLLSQIESTHAPAAAAVNGNGAATNGSPSRILGWVSGRRCLKNIVFLDLTDSTGTVQAVVKADTETNERTGPEAENVFDIASRVTPESSVEVTGELVIGPTATEFELKSLQVLGNVVKQVSPMPRRNFDISDTRFTEQCLTNRHLYLRHPRLKALLKLRHEIMGAVHNWFRAQDYIQFDAPVLTPLPLYEDSTALAVDINGQKVFLTQCVGFYLDAAAHVFERVYNIGPSFRGEESRSLRHLMEYWHIKAEVAWSSREDTMTAVESLVGFVCEHAKAHCDDVWEVLGESPAFAEGTAKPFPRLSYPEAVEILQQAGEEFPFGTSLGTKGENILAARFNTPFWVVGNPRTVEPFPYCIDPEDERLTLTADLILPRGFGELLGVEKIFRSDELELRLAEKGKGADSRYDWVRDLRRVGSVPRGAFGMGVERLIRWIANVPHVRDCIGFPRVFRRQVFP